MPLSLSEIPCFLRRDWKFGRSIPTSSAALVTFQLLRSNAEMRKACSRGFTASSRSFFFIHFKYIAV